MTVTDWISLVLLVLCFLLTLLMFSFHANIDPLGDRTARASEGFILVLMIMGIRWALLLVVVWMLPFNWPWLLLATGIHIGLGVANMWIWNRWVSIIYDKTRTELHVLCWTYLFLPLAVILTLAALKFLVHRTSISDV